MTDRVQARGTGDRQNTGEVKDRVMARTGDKHGLTKASKGDKVTPGAISCLWRSHRPDMMTSKPLPAHHVPSERPLSPQGSCREIRRTASFLHS